MSKTTGLVQSAFIPESQNNNEDLKKQKTYSSLYSFKYINSLA